MTKVAEGPDRPLPAARRAHRRGSPRAARPRVRCRRRPAARRGNHTKEDDVVKPLEGVRIIESSMLGPAEMGGLSADLGAEVIKVEPPGGDYGRQMTWPIVRQPAGRELPALPPCQPGQAVDRPGPAQAGGRGGLPRSRPGRRRRHRGHAPRGAGQAGLTFEAAGGQPRIVFCRISGYGATGPYKDMPSHGIVYDTWAGQVPIEDDENGYTVHARTHQHRDPRRAPLRRPGHPGRRHRGPGHREGSSGHRPVGLGRLLRLVPHRDLEGLRPPRGRGLRQRDRRRRAPGARHRRHAGRRPLPDLRHLRRLVLFMASEQAFWKNFSEGSAAPISSSGGRAANTATTPATTRNCRAS